MTIPYLHIRATNVELTTLQERKVAQVFLPITRFLRHDPDAAVTVSVRQDEETYFVSEKAVTTEDNYMAVAAKPTLAHAARAARDMLRRAMSRGESVATPSATTLSSMMAEQYTLTL